MEEHYFDLPTIMAFGLPGKTDVGIPTEYDKHGVIVKYCSMAGGIISWTENDGPTPYQQKRVTIPDHEFMCVKHKDTVDYYFDNIYGCGCCKYKEVCRKKHSCTPCYAIKQLTWNSDKCYVKELFKYVEQKKIKETEDTVKA